jgi:hypothetical protein
MTLERGGIDWYRIDVNEWVATVAHARIGVRSDDVSHMWWYHIGDDNYGYRMCLTLGECFREAAHWYNKEFASV